MTAAPENQTALRISIRRSLALLLFARTVLDTGARAVYPFLPFIAAGFGVSVAAASQIVQIRNLLGLTTPLFGPLLDRYGRRVMMLAGLALLAVTGIALYWVTALWQVVLVMTIMGFSTILYIPAQQAYLGDTVPYAQRGRVMAMAEFSWSISAIVGMPLIGILVQAYGWQYGFIAIGFFAIAAVVLLWYGLPRDKKTMPHVARAFGGAYWDALRAPMALAVLTTSFLLALTNENINITFAEWLHGTFGLDAAALGIVGASIGVAEFLAQLTLVLFVDRVGKWKMVAGGLVIGVIAYLALPFMGANPWLGAAGVVFTFFTFELTIVAALPIVTEIAPHVRGTVLTLGVAFFSLGRAAGSFLGPALVTQFGFGAVSLASAAGIAVACVIWFLFVREKKREVITT